MSEEQNIRKKSTVRHTRAIQRDRTKRPVSTPTATEVKERLTELVHPATLAQVGHFYDLGLRERTLGLVVMVAFIIEMIWRQISGVSEMSRIVQKEMILWASPVKVSQQGLSDRLTSLPAELFLNVLIEVIPVAQQRWKERQRPLLPEIAWAMEQYNGVYLVDGSTYLTLFEKDCSTRSNRVK